VAGLPIPGCRVTVEQLLAGIRDGNYHAGGIRCLRLLRVAPDWFTALRAEVASLCRDGQPSDVTASDHVTHWTRPRGEVVQYSLLNRSGRFDDTSADHDLSCADKRFHHADWLPALGALAAALPHAINLRVNVLGPQARLSPHEEHSIVRLHTGAIGARVRFHLPVETSPLAELVLDGEVHALTAGTVHFVNHGCVHAARNGGAERRVHLVWDQLLTREAHAFLFGDAPLPAWLVRVPEADRTPAPLRTERMGAHVALPPPVSREDADRIALCLPQ